MRTRACRRWALVMLLIAACTDGEEEIDFGLTCGSIPPGLDSEHILQNTGLAREVAVEVGELSDDPEVVAECGAPAGTWAVQAIEHGLDVSPFNHGVAVDSGGTLHVGYSDGFTVRHALLASGHWSIEEVASGGVYTVAIAVGTGDEIHFAWDEPRTGVSHAVRGAEGWRVEMVMPVSYASDVCLAVDREGAAHLGVAVRDEAGSYAFVLASNESDRWTADVVTWGAMPRECSLALGPSGRIHATFDTFDLGYATVLGGELVEAALHDAGQDSSIAALEGGRAVIASMASFDRLILTEGSVEEGFQRRFVEDLPGAGPNGGTPALLLDPEGRATIAASRCGGISLLRETDVGWEVEQATDEVSSGQVALAIDGDGVPHVIYATQTDLLRGSLMHAWRCGESCPEG